MKMKFLYSLFMGTVLAIQSISAAHPKFDLKESVFEQGFTVTGTIVDETGVPLPGASIIEKGSTNGVTSDFNGNFSITILDKNAILAISYIGFDSKEVPLNGQSTINVVLQENATGLDEVVLIGYGGVKASDATGAVSSIKAEDFNGGVISSPEQLIQGKSAGVQITSSSGEPGSGINIRVRGTGSIRSGNQPLFVIDGVPISGDNISDGGNVPGTGGTAPKNPLNFMNPNDIASIDILKDASATAIYGSRGANGVVIITTKKGSGKGSLNYAYSIGMSEITKKYDVGNAQEFLTGYSLVGGSDPNIDQGAETDWQDEILRTAISQNHELSYGGGNQSGNYRFSFSHSDQQGIIKENGLERMTGRFNGNKKILNDRLEISTQLTISNIHDDNVPITDSADHQGDLLAGALKTNPTRPVYNPDGTLYQPSRDNPNPVAFLELSRDFSNTLKFLGSFSADAELFEWLSFKTVYGIDRSMSTRKSAFSSELVAAVVNAEEDNGRAAINSIEIDNLLWENYFTVKHDFKDIGLDLNAVLGYSYQKFQSSGNSMAAADFRVTDLDLMLNNMTAANLTAVSNTFKTIDELQSYFTRINLTYKQKYYLTSTVRIDGSTRFGSDYAYGTFPSLAFKWKLSQEDFIPDFFSNLSLRAGWGNTGNQDIAHDLYTRRQRYGSPSFNVQDGVVIPGGLATVTFENQGLKWEETQQTSIGLEFGFLDNRLRGSIDYYNKTTTDMLVQLSAAEPAPQAFVWRNLDADVINKGIEFDLTYDAIQNDDFGWTIAGNASFNENTVENFDFGFLETGSIKGQGLSGINVERIQNGHPLYAFYLPSFEGFDSDGNAIYGDTGFTGDKPLPTATAALTNTLRYKNFDLNIFFAGQFGHSIYSNTANSFFHAPAVSSGRNAPLEVLTGEERNTSSVNVSTRYLEKADFVRLQDVTLGYKVNINENSPFSAVRLSLTGQNLFVITGYSGQDPEVNTNRSDNGVPSAGIDYTSYPRARTFLLGVNVSF
ncbi:SusC/RagA family TonB-linked outer membrane protein [Arenibacter sp. ARW7G5Y1]|uniref:SusC/RagA family TonB-linked outer membrane protein n=1 Tax=Arenibacter sp. ARW7G5Y1 TaxID=2135619 RepID=UPI000D774643|nr:SusC/RagA family TonB-linked outer membrane protein [Arenibacter sp. ARW7G5Y1]